jgi:hypothetical protein
MTENSINAFLVLILLLAFAFVTYRRVKKLTTKQARLRTILESAFAPSLFIVIGPWLGLFIFMLVAVPVDKWLRAIVMALFPISVIFAYLFGALPALATGLVASILGKKSNSVLYYFFLPLFGGAISISSSMYLFLLKENILLSNLPEPVIHNYVVIFIAGSLSACILGFVCRFPSNYAIKGTSV